MQRFYADLFGWNIDADNEWQYGIVVPGGDRGINGGIGGDPGGNSRVSVYIEVDDLEGYLEKVERLGGRVVMPPMDVAGVTIALFTDPAGNFTGLTKSGGAAG